VGNVPISPLQYHLVSRGFLLIDKPFVQLTQFPSVSEKWDATSKMSSFNIPLIIQKNYDTKNRFNIELGMFFIVFITNILKIIIMSERSKYY